MDLSKSYEFFKPSMCKYRIHIIGCGSVGSTLAELLARFGLTNFVLYDFDVVEAHNIANQMFTAQQIGMSKLDATAELLKAINPEIKIEFEPEGYTDQPLDGYVFLAVDSIELRRKIAESNRRNRMVRGMLDFRTGLTDAQHFAADWSKSDQVDSFIKSMNFSDTDAAAANPVSACGVELSVAPTVRMICNVGAANFTNWLKGEDLKRMILIDAFAFYTEAV